MKDCLGSQRRSWLRASLRWKQISDRLQPLSTVCEIYLMLRSPYIHVCQTEDSILNVGFVTFSFDLSKEDWDSIIVAQRVIDLNDLLLKC